MARLQATTITGSLYITASGSATVALNVTGSSYFSGSTFIASGSSVGITGSSVFIGGGAMVFRGNTADFSGVGTVTLGSNVTATPAAHNHPTTDITGILPSTKGGTGMALDKDNITHFTVPMISNVAALSGGGGTIPGTGTEGTIPGGSDVFFRPGRVLASGSNANSTDWKMAINTDVIANQIYTLYVNGNTGVNGTITELSTRDIKKNIVALNDELSNISKLIPVEYDYIETNEHSIGFIAEEFDEVYPSLVVRDANGKPDSIAYANLVSPIVRAIQQLSEKLDVLTSRVEALENK